MKPEVANRRIESFCQHFGEAHLYLAYHAAFPLALTPDLLYRLWANFQRDIHGELLNIPWLAVADLLLSSLCDEVGYELYEMDKAVRNLLLRKLKTNSRFGEQRISELSDFLLTYVRDQLESYDPDMRDFAQAQRWTALAYTKPSEAARELALALKKLNLEEKAEWVRMASLVETFAEPLANFKPLLLYSRGMANFVRNNWQDAEAQFNQLHLVKPEVKIAGISLDIPLEPAVFVKENISDYQNVKPDTGKIALLIGVSEFDNPVFNPIPSAKKDVEAMHRVLSHPEMGAFNEVISLMNPDSLTMQVAIEQLFIDRRKDDVVLLYFSGHGIKDNSGQLHFATRSSRKTPEGVLFNAVSAIFIHEVMQRSRSKRQVIILDCCFSGAFAQGMKIKGDDSLDIRNQLGGEGRAVLTSASSVQYSFVKEGEDLSIYTRYLVEGIETGSADIDGDGWISVDELHSYTRSKVMEVFPYIRPEFYPIREGYSIRLAKAPVDNPKLKYRKEVDRLANQGKFSIPARRLLNLLRTQLQLTSEVAEAIEAEVLQPYREYQRKLQEYENVLNESVKAEYPLSQSTIDDLRSYQQFLGLRQEDIAPIEMRILGSTNYINTFAPNEESSS